MSFAIRSFQNAIMLFRLGPGFWIETSCFIFARGSILLQAVKCQSRLGVYKTPHVSFVKGGITTVERREREAALKQNQTTA